MDLLALTLLFLAGLIAGIINTVGGGGSILTLPALIFIGGVPAVAANATNRIGLIVQNATALWRFRAGGIKEDRLALWMTGAALPGAAIGAFLAARISNELFEPLLGWIMLALLALILFKPKTGLKRRPGTDGMHPWAAASPRRRIVLLVGMFIIGVYMGFLQAGGGIMILVMFGYLLDFSLVRANYIKLMVIFLTNLLAFGVFIYQGVSIYWLAGIMVFLGQICGAYVGSWIALEKGETWMKVILTVSILAASAKLIGLF